MDKIYDFKKFDNVGILLNYLQSFEFNVFPLYFFLKYYLADL